MAIVKCGLYVITESSSELMIRKIYNPFFESFASVLLYMVTRLDCVNKIHEGRRKKIHAARLKRKQNVLREEIKLNKLEYKLTSQKLYSYQFINESLFFGIPIEPQQY